MVLPYYRRLGRRQRAVYRASDALPLPSLTEVEALRVLASEVEVALASGEARVVGASVRRLVAALAEDLSAPGLRVSVRAKRPANATEELHGLYEPEWTDEDDAQHPAVITVWMRTVAHDRVVRFRTFMRTVLHELMHHLDYEVYGLEESFHTEGFFRRESALMRQLCPKPEQPAEASSKQREPAPARTDAQLSFGF